MVCKRSEMVPVVLFFCLFGFEFSTQRMMDRLGLFWDDSICWMESLFQQPGPGSRSYAPLGKPIKIDAKKVAKFSPS